MIKSSKKATITMNILILGLSAAIGITTSFLLKYNKVLYGIIAGLATLLIAKIIEFSVSSLTGDRMRDVVKPKVEDLIANQFYFCDEWHPATRIFGEDGDIVYDRDGKVVPDRTVNITEYMRNNLTIGAKYDDSELYKDPSSGKLWIINSHNNFFSFCNPLPKLSNFTSLKLNGYTIKKQVIEQEQIPTSEILLDGFKQTVSFGFGGNK